MQWRRMRSKKWCLIKYQIRVSSAVDVHVEFQIPSFLPKQVETIKHPFARKLATMIERLGCLYSCIMSSCVRPSMQNETNQMFLLHGFDRMRFTYPLFEEAGVETWALDVLGWGFSGLELPPCNVASKREHLYQVSFLKSTPLRLFAKFLAFDNFPFTTRLDWTNVGRLHCLLPWWKNATVDFMISGGYNVCNQIAQVKQETLISWGEDDLIISNKLAVRLHSVLPDTIVRLIPDCDHIPHVEELEYVAKLIKEFIQDCSVVRC